MELQTLFLIKQPECRKRRSRFGWSALLRWRAAGRGKRGGYRVIYFARMEQGVIWMLTLYPKNVKENIPASALRRIRKEVENG